ncbi:MAG: sugar kinase [Prevotella sp.]|nr:sugar kinase [Prevotella sp.]MBQ9216266.1 sugar kinase [Prevotella sp.]
MRIVTFGEVLLRFSKADNQRISQGNTMNANYGGSEANAAVSLSILGNEVRYVTRLPKNAMGQACIRKLSEMGLDTHFVCWGGERIGTYFFEQAASLRSPRMVYDRKDSAFYTLKPGMIPWREVFRDVDVFHCSGITCALSQDAADATFEAVRIADEMGLTIACDINYRKNLWNYGAKAAEVLPRLMTYSDVIFGDAGEWELAGGLPRIPFLATSSDYPIDMAAYTRMFEQIAEKFPRCQKFILGLRNEVSTNHHLLSGVLYNRERLFTAKIYDINPVVDPMGVGDAYLAAYLHAYLNRKDDDQRCLDFSLAASALKSTINGDFNLSTEDEVLSLL